MQTGCDTTSAVLQAGDIQEFNPYLTNIDKPTKKQAKRAALITRLRNITPVTQHRLQQAYQFLGLPQLRAIAETRAARPPGAVEQLLPNQAVASASQQHQAPVSAEVVIQPAVYDDGLTTLQRNAHASAAAAVEPAKANAMPQSAGEAIAVAAAAAPKSGTEAVTAATGSAEAAAPASTAALTDAAPPAYVEQMDGPNDVTDAIAAVHASAPCAASRAEVNAHPEQQTQMSIAEGAQLTSDAVRHLANGPELHTTGKRNAQDLDFGPAAVKRQKISAGVRVLHNMSGMHDANGNTVGNRRKKTA